MSKNIYPIEVVNDECGTTQEVVLNFGIGQFQVGYGMSNEEEGYPSHPYVMFSVLTEPVEQGKNIEDTNAKVDEHAPHFIMSFLNEYGLDVVIDGLMKAKESFKNVKQ